MTCQLVMMEEKSLSLEAVPYSPNACQSKGNTLALIYGGIAVTKTQHMRPIGKGFTDVSFPVLSFPHFIGPKVFFCE